MALLFVDGFDHYTATGGFLGSAGPLLQKWDLESYHGTGAGGLEVGAAGGRYGTGGIAFQAGHPFVAGGATVQKLLAAPRATLIVGFAFTIGALPADGYLGLASLGVAGQLQAELCLGPAGTLAVFTGGASAPLGESAPVVPAEQWVYLQWKCTIGNAGAYEVRYYDTPVLSGGGDTQAHASDSTADRVGLGNPRTRISWFYRVDDLYVCDTAGAANADFLGDTRITTLLPNGPGAVTQWTPSAGANWECTDDASPNSDTDYVASATAGQTDVYQLPDVTTPTGLVRGLQVSAFARKDDAGTRTLRPALRVGGTVYTGADIVVTDSYDYTPQVFETSPATGSAWTLAEVNALEAGHTLQS